MSIQPVPRLGAARRVVVAGLALSGVGTRATLSNVRVHGNYGQQGAALSVEVEAELFVIPPADDCGGALCDRVFTGNIDGSGFRGVVAAFVGALVQFESAGFEGNQGRYLFYVSDEFTTLRAAGLTIWDNRLATSSEPRSARRPNSTSSQQRSTRSPTSTTRRSRPTSEATA